MNIYNRDCSPPLTLAECGRKLLLHEPREGLVSVISCSSGATGVPRGCGGRILPHFFITSSHRERIESSSDENMPYPYWLGRAYRAYNITPTFISLDIKASFRNLSADRIVSGNWWIQMICVWNITNTRTHARARARAHTHIHIHREIWRDVSGDNTAH